MIGLAECSVYKEAGTIFQFIINTNGNENSNRITTSAIMTEIYATEEESKILPHRFERPYCCQCQWAKANGLLALYRN